MMNSCSTRWVAAALAMVIPAAAAAQGAASSRAIDAVWSAASAAVAANDIVGLGRIYHPSAVVVTTTTVPVAKALAGWGTGMEDAKKSGSRPTVAFRFSARQDDPDTAFESGIFAYAVGDKGGTRQVRYTRFEALLVREHGKWLMLMERQLAPATEADWNALPH